VGKEFFAGFYLVAGAVIAAYLFRAMTKKDPLGKSMTRAMGAGLLVVIAYILYLCVNDFRLMAIGCSLVFVGIDWCLFFLVQFSRQFVGLNKPKYHEYEILGGILAADSLHLLLNPFYQQTVSFKMVVIHGAAYLERDAHALFYIHLTLCYIMVAWIYFVLLRKYLQVAKFYRARYAVINAAFMAVIILNAAYLIVHTHIDYSILGYAFVGCFLYFYVYDYKGEAAANATKAYFVEEMNNPIVFFDYEGKLLMSNHRAREILNLAEEETISDFIKKNDYLTMNEEEEQSFETTLVSKDKVFYFQIKYKFLTDKDGKTIGSYFVYEDITEKKRALIQTEYNATHDILTGTYNRNYFASFKKEIGEKQLYPVYGAIFDVNGLRDINKIYGLETGDRVLKRMAWLMQQFSRVTDYVIRMDGGEMALILPATGERKAEEIFKRIERRIGNFEVAGLDISVTSSYFHLDNIEDFDKLYEEARSKIADKKKNEMTRKTSS